MEFIWSHLALSGNVKGQPRMPKESHSALVVPAHSEFQSSVQIIQLFVNLFSQGLSYKKETMSMGDCLFYDLEGYCLPVA